MLDPGQNDNRLSPVLTEQNRADPVAAFLAAATVPRDGSAHPSGTLDEAERILAAHPEVRRASIFTAAALGDEAAVRGFLAADPASATAKGGPYRWDALTHLCFSRYLRFQKARAAEFARTARALLEAGADANTGWYEAIERGDDNLEFESVIYGAAAVAQSLEITRLLLEHGADPNDAETAYHVAESYDNAVMQLLLESGTFNQQSLVILLCRKADSHDVDGLKLALQHGANPNQLSLWGSSAFHHAIRRDNRLPMLALLLDHGADPAVRSTRDGRTCAETTARRGRGDVLREFARRGIDPGFDRFHRLIACCARADRPGAEALLQQTPELRSALRAEGASLLAEFSWNGNLEGVRCLLDFGVPVDGLYDEPDGYYQLGKRTTALHVAAWRSHPEVVRALLARGAAADTRDDRGRTPLVLAVRACIDSYWMERRSPDSVAALLQAGASPSEIPLPTGYDPIDALLHNAPRA